MPAVAIEPVGPAVAQPTQGRTLSSQSLTYDHIPTREELVKLNQDILANAKQPREFLEK